MDTDALRETLRHVVGDDAGPMLNGDSYLTVDGDGIVFAVVDIGFIRDQRFADTSLIARLEGNTIVVEFDGNNKPLVDALLDAGVPRSQIILAYAGEAARPAA